MNDNARCDTGGAEDYRHQTLSDIDWIVVVHGANGQFMASQFGTQIANNVSLSDGDNRQFNGFTIWLGNLHSFDASHFKVEKWDFGEVRFEGTSGNDTIIGSAGANTFYNIRGDDVLIGNVKRDTLYFEQDTVFRGIIDGGTAGNFDVNTIFTSGHQLDLRQATVERVDSLYIGGSGTIIIDAAKIGVSNDTTGKISRITFGDEVDHAPQPGDHL